jgi:hypothetical protein
LITGFDYKGIINTSLKRPDGRILRMIFHFPNEPKPVPALQTTLPHQKEIAYLSSALEVSR